MGRPKLGEGEGKRVPLNMRTTEHLRARMEDAAAKSGRSIAQEVERRLERSFELKPLLGAMTRDTASLTLFRTLGRAVGSIRKRSREEGWSELQTREALKAGLDMATALLFWTGDEVSSVLDPYKSPLAPAAPTPFPALDAEQLVVDSMSFASAFDENDLFNDFGECLRNVWSGDGSETIDPKTIKPEDRHLPMRAWSDIAREIEQHWAPKDGPKPVKHDPADGPPPPAGRPLDEILEEGRKLRDGARPIRKKQS